MRKPLLQRDIALAVSAAGLAAIVAAVRLPAVGEGAAQVALMVFGVTALPLGGIWALMAWTVARTEAALRRGDGVMGRWQVDAATWQAFLALDSTLASASDAQLNELAGRRARARGVEVIVGKEGVLIGEHVFRLPRRGLPEITLAGLRMEPGTPVCIELHLYYPPTPTRFGTSPARRSVLRFPVAATAEREAARIVTYYHQGRPGEADFFHGKGDGSNPEDLSTCRACGWQTHKYTSVCERCGGSMLSKRWARRLGGVLVVLGLALAIGLGYLLWIMGPMLLNPGVSFGGTRFSGTRVQALLIFAVLGSVFLFGVLTTGYGLWQMLTGARNMKAVYTMVGLIAVAVVVGTLLT